MAINKNDYEARSLWGDAYDSIPKSVFAVAVWHLASLCGDGEAGGSARRFAEEVRALGLNGCIDESQMKRAVKALEMEGMLA